MPFGEPISDEERAKETREEGDVGGEPKVKRPRTKERVDWTGLVGLCPDWAD